MHVGGQHLAGKAVETYALPLTETVGVADVVGRRGAHKVKPHGAREHRLVTEHERGDGAEAVVEKHREGVVVYPCLVQCVFLDTEGLAARLRQLLPRVVF